MDKQNTLASVIDSEQATTPSTNQRTNTNTPTLPRYGVSRERQSLTFLPFLSSTLCKWLITLSYKVRHMTKSNRNNKPTHEPKNRKSPKWQLSLLKMLLTTLLPLLLHSPDITLHIYHIHIFL